MTAKNGINRNMIFRIIKRTFDILFSLLSLLIVAPVLIIITICIKMSGPGPIFFKQTRIGLAGKRFDYLKFRTMNMNATELETGPVFSLKYDPRITPFGAFLRSTALDELPQFISVLKGDMSIIGPRPALPLEIKHYTDDQKERFNVRPGITGYWQTYGREKGIHDLNNMIEMDLEYIRKQSLWLDLKIIGKTILMGLLKKGAY